VTYLITSFYWDNLYKLGLAPKKADDGQLAWTFPMGDSKLAGIATEDIGKTAYGIFKAGQPYIGRTVGILGDALTIEEMGKTISRVLGVGPIKYNAVDADTYRGLGFPGADETGNMFQAYRDFAPQFLANRDLAETRKLNPSLQTFEQFVTRHKDQIRGAMGV